MSPAGDGLGSPERSSTLGGVLLHHLDLLLPGFDDIQRHRPVLAPLVLVTGLSVASTFSIQPLLWEASAGDAGHGLSIWLWLAAIFSPLIAGGKALTLAVVAWSVLVVVGREVRVKVLLSVFLYGEAILALHGVAIVLVLHLRGPDAVTDLEDLYVPMGLDGLLPSVSPVLDAVIRGVNAFHLAWFLFLALAMARTPDISDRAAWLLAGAAWTLTLSVAALRALAFG